MKYEITCPQSYRNGPQPPKLPKKKHLNFEHSSLPILIGHAFITIFDYFFYKNYLEKDTNLERNLSPSYSDVKNTKDRESI